MTNGTLDVAKKIAIGVITSAIVGSWAYATTRASEDDLKEVEAEVERAHRRADQYDVNQAVIITTLDNIAKEVGASGVPEKVLRKAEETTAKNGGNR